MLSRHPLPTTRPSAPTRRHQTRHWHLPLLPHPRWPRRHCCRPPPHRTHHHPCSRLTNLLTRCKHSGRKRLIVWDLATAQARHQLSGHEGWVSGCAISASGSMGLSASDDRTLIVWDLATGEERHRLRDHERAVQGCAISADGSTGLSASSDRTLIVWDLVTGEARHRLRG